MNLDKFLVIAGVPGVHKLIATRNNGLLIEDRKEGRTRFVATRQNQVTPLGTVAVYVDTDEETLPLTDVFQRMLDQLEAAPPVPASANSTALREYFTQILPEHDRDRVHINDIKKCVKWFHFMQEAGIFEEAKREAELAAAEKDEEKKEETPGPEKTETS